MRSLLYSMNNLSLLLRACLIHSNSYYNEIGIGILMNKNCNVIYIYIEREIQNYLREPQLMRVLGFIFICYNNYIC